MTQLLSSSKEQSTHLNTSYLSQKRQHRIKGNYKALQGVNFIIKDTLQGVKGFYLE